MQDPCRTTVPRLRSRRSMSTKPEILKKYDGKHYKAVCVGAAAFVDAPSSSGAYG